MLSNAQVGVWGACIEYEEGAQGSLSYKISEKSPKRFYMIFLEKISILLCNFNLYFTQYASFGIFCFQQKHDEKNQRQVLTLGDERLTLETSVFESFTVANLPYRPCG